MVDECEVPGIYWETVNEQLDSHNLSSRVIERLEVSARAGLPARKTPVEIVQPGEKDATESVGAGETMDLGLADDDARIDLDLAVRNLGGQDLQILRAYAER